jgi:hypothetical protein
VKFSKLIFISAMLLSSNVMAVMPLDASSLKLKVYSVMLSTSALCTNPVTIFSSAVPTEVDFLSTPTLGSGNPDDGTYNCIIIKMSDNIKFKPSTSSGSCTGGTEYTGDICRTDNSGTTRAPDPGAVASNCTGTGSAPSADIVYLYLTTNPAAGTGGNNFVQPADASSTNGLHLTAPLVISGTATSKFVVNATGKVDGGFSSCGMNPPVFGFAKL